MPSRSQSASLLRGLMSAPESTCRGLARRLQFGIAVTVILDYNVSLKWIWMRAVKRQQVST